MFKSGDKVRVLSSYGNGSPLIGTIVTLNKRQFWADEKGVQAWTFDEEGNLVFSDDFELMKEFSFSTIKLKVKRLHPQAIIPSYAKPGDAAMDLTATTVTHLRAENGSSQVKYGTGLAFEIPEGHVGLIFPRSSICKTTLALSNSVGVIDSGYRGEVQFVFNDIGRDAPNYILGERIGQLMVIPYPKMEIEEVEELGDTERGAGGFGSSGK